MSAKPWMMLVSMMAGWINRQQQEALEYLKEENKILRDEVFIPANYGISVSIPHSLNS